jgi:hypothetical protein
MRGIRSGTNRLMQRIRLGINLIQRIMVCMGLVLVASLVRLGRGD